MMHTPWIPTLQQKERNWQWQQQTVLETALTLPTCNGKGAAARRFRYFYRCYSGAFEALCRRQLYPRAAERYRRCRDTGDWFVPCRAELTTCITLLSDNIFSLYTQIAEDSSGRTTLLRRSDTWDLRQGLPLRLEDCFTDGKVCKKTLVHELLALAETQQRRGQVNFREEYRQALKRSFNRRNFYLTPDAVVLFYQQGVLSSPGSGVVSFSLPWGTAGSRQSGLTNKENSAIIAEQ